MAGFVTIGGKVALEGGDRHVHAARRLAESFPRLAFVPASHAAGLPSIRLVEDVALAEGAFEIGNTVEPLTITVRGGPFSGVIYGVEELIRRARVEGGSVLVPDAPISGRPGLAYRTFWTWDHSTNWELSQVGHQEIGVFNPYGKPPSGLLADYCRLVDFASRNRIGAVIVYGFLRDSHGGVAAAQELCRYANERGVRILPGIAIGAYGGVYWEGDHPYNLATWLKKNPQHAATLEKGIGFQIADLDFPLSFPRSDYTMSACPSAPETMDWMEEAVDWLASTFEIGGINIESGDYGVCGCARCVARRNNEAEARRRAEETGDSWSHTDMAENFPRLFRTAKARRPDSWIYCEMQWDNLFDPVAQQAQNSLPEGALYQHTTNRTYWKRLDKELTRADVARLPTQPNVLRCQFASQWNGDRRTERYGFNGRVFADMNRFCSRVGMQGLAVWGEVSAYHATTELSYLAYARTAWEPELPWERFMAEDAAPLFGGLAAAERFVAIAEELDANIELPVERLRALRGEAHDGASSPDDQISRRWSSLQDAIGRRLFMGR